MVTVVRCISMQWKDLTTSWVYLNWLNKYYIFDLPWYALDNQIMGNSEFDWWARELLKRSELIIG